MALADDVMDFFEASSSLHMFLQKYPGVKTVTAHQAASKLVQSGHLAYLGTVAGSGGTALTNAHYVVPTYPVEGHSQAKQNGVYRFVVEGWPAVRDARESLVGLVEVVDSSGIDQCGSGFLLRCGETVVFVTAKHCVFGMRETKINFGANKHEIPPSTWKLHETVDIAYVNLGGGEGLAPRNPELLEPVLTLGYPKIPGLLPVVVAETAEVATPQVSSTGAIAAATDGYLDGQRYWLLTAKVKGGNSGGPVVGADGCVIGMVSMIPELQDQPHLLGYATMVSIEEITEFVNAG
jgi:serine protease Do